MLSAVTVQWLRFGQSWQTVSPGVRSDSWTSQWGINMSAGPRFQLGLPWVEAQSPWSEALSPESEALSPESEALSPESEAGGFRGA